MKLPLPQSVAQILVLAAAYYGTGKLGLLLAIPPGYATAFWPPSGIALAALLTAGSRVWPGILIGSFLVNVGTSFDASSPAALATSLALALGIGLGATLQAIAGTWLVRRFVTAPLELIREQDVATFMILGGPVSCLINATMSVSLLALAGVVAWPQYGFSWWTWWVGDTIGAVVVAPLCLIWLAEPRHVWRRRRVSLAVPCGVLLTLVVVLFVRTSAWEQARIEREFQSQATAMTEALVRKLDDTVDVLHSMASFLSIVPHVDREAFRRFVEGPLTRYRGVQALSWNRRVPGSERGEFEQWARTHVSPEFRITERSPEGTLVPAERRSEYVTVVYIESLQGNEPALGFDVASDAVRREALARARRTGQASATAPIRLVQESGSQSGVLVFLPVYGPGGAAPGDEVLGFATGVVRLDDLLHAALEGLPMSSLAIALYDVSDQPESTRLLLASTNAGQGGPARPAALSLERDVPMLGRRWSATVQSSPEHEALTRSWRPWIVLAGGLLFTGVLGAFLLVVTGRAVMIERFGAQRAEVLSQANAALEREAAERTQAQDALRDSEARFRLLFASNPLPMWVYDVTTLAFLEVNDAAVQHYGYSRDEFLAMRLTDIRPPEDVPQLTATVARLAGVAGTRHAGTWKHRLKDGRLRDVEVRAHSIPFAGRKAALVVANDVTELTSAQQALATYTERLDVLHDIDRAVIAAHAPVVIAEAVIRRLRDLLGVPRAIVSLFDLAAGEAEWLVAAGRRRVHGGPGVRFPLRMMGDVDALQRGELQVVDATALPPGPDVEALLASGVSTYMVVPMIASGELIGALSFGGASSDFPPDQVSIATEVATQLAIALAQARLHERVQRQADELQRQLDELHRAQAQLLQTEKIAAMGQLLAGVAHELNNPLSVIIGQATMLQRAMAGTPQALRVERMAQAAERCARIVRNFLALARQRPPERQAVQLNRVVEEAVELLAYQLKVENIQVALALSADLPELWADPHQLHQVVVNLVTNARDALRQIPPPRHLAVTTGWSADPAEVRLEVLDTGPGMPADVQARIFEPFFTTKAPGQGTGLGLPLCLGIIESHGGRLTVDSRPGQTRFHVTLPVQAPPSSETDAVATVALPVIRGKTILVVDDEDEVATLLADVLALHDHRVETVANGRIALERLRAQSYDVILSDMRMPELDGIGLYRALEQHDPALLRRIIFLTGDTLGPEIAGFLERTQVPRVTKPFTIQDVHRVTQEILRALA